MEADILEAYRRLRTFFPEQKNWTFAYPCYEDYVGRGETRQSYVPIFARHFIAARGDGHTGAANAPFACDMHHLWSWPVNHMNWAGMIGLVQRAVTTSRWGILTFHGIDEGHLLVSSVDFEELLAFLASNQDRVWTAPVAEVAEYVRDLRSQQKRTARTQS